ncbi:hypothetical protein BLOT_013793 [Blomia tropicalis]|nr:hypothetical protein BLOT_013793 [Blomia tropicalis]
MENGSIRKYLFYMMMMMIANHRDSLASTHTKSASTIKGDMNRMESNNHDSKNTRFLKEDNGFKEES